MNNLKMLNDMLEDRANEEVTWYRGKYHFLHICQNGNPVPYFISENAHEIKDYINHFILESQPDH